MELCKVSDGLNLQMSKIFARNAFPDTMYPKLDPAFIASAWAALSFSEILTPALQYALRIAKYAQLQQHAHCILVP